MAETRQIYWLTPGVLLTSLLLGILVSIGHHLFYHSLAGKEVPTGEYTIAGTSFSKQQFNLAIGTTFAFLAKSFLITAVSTVYFQAFWLVVKRRKGGTRLSVLDTTFSGLDSITALCKVTVWCRQPLLLILAIIAWSIPIAAIVTPATLSIQSALFSPSSMTQVPNLDFTTFDFNSPMLVGGADGSNQTDYSYIGPSIQVSQVANGVFAQGQILPISSPQSNASWSLQLWAPALQCANVSADAKHDIGVNMLSYLTQANDSLCYLSPAYVAWIPPAGNFTPFANINGTSALRSNQSMSFGNTWSLYVAVMPEMFEDMLYLSSQSVPLGCQDAVLIEDHNPDRTIDLMIETFLGQDNSTVLECHAYNASYVLDFEFINGFQTVNVSINDSGETLEAIAHVTGPDSLSSGGDDTNRAPGLAEMANQTCSTLNDKGQQCLFEPELLRKLSYQAIVQAFAENLIGYIGLAPSNGDDYVWASNSEALNTILMNTEELAFMQDWQMNGEHDGSFADLGLFASHSNGSQYVGLSNNVTKATRGSLGQTLESLFANYTVSLMSENQLLPNYTSQYAPPPTTNVTYTATHNVYYYSASTLWIAYGIAIGAATLAAISGLSMILWEGETYDRKFSTVLRVGRANVLTEAVETSEASGAQPLSKKLAAARMIITEIRGKRAGEEGEDDDGRDGVGVNDPDAQADQRNLL